MSRRYREHSYYESNARERLFGILDEGSFREFLRGVGRQDARELIFGTLLESAGEGALDGGETDLLDWLSKTWNIKIEIADGEIV